MALPAENPFTALTIVVAPAILTNASSLLCFGTANRLARVMDRTRAVSAQLAGAGLNEGNRAMYEHQLRAGIEMLLHVTRIIRRCCVDLAVRVHARLFSPARGVHRNCTY